MCGTQVSDLAMDMYRRGIFKKPSHSNRAYSRTTEPVLVERKDTTKVSKHAPDIGARFLFRGPNSANTDAKRRTIR